ncbi:MAG: hypothetical protein IPO06_22725 [Leptospiraceae bacterium]|nr:hypothetical protein [Leptospiraceae bacterium]
MARKVNVAYSQIIENISDIHLSLSQFIPAQKKELSGSGHTKESRLTIEEHLEKLKTEGRLKSPSKPLLVLSVRNVMANLRCVAYIKGFTEEILGVAEEIPSERPYFVFGKKDSKYVMENVNPKTENLENWDWFLSGVPVLWDNASELELFQNIVTEAADHSHVWKIYRGNHPEATETSRTTWEELQKIFVRTLSENRENSYKELHNFSHQRNLERETKYLHNVIGVDESGSRLYQLVTVGKLEDIGQELKRLGATRAICVDNSGSSVVRFYPKGFAGDGIQEFAAPNHRSAGTAYLAVELGDSGFWMRRE